jgi:hypothetical protein
MASARPGLALPVLAKATPRCPPRRFPFCLRPTTRINIGCPRTLRVLSIPPFHHALLLSPCCAVLPGRFAPTHMQPHFTAPSLRFGQATFSRSTRHSLSPTCCAVGFTARSCVMRTLTHSLGWTSSLSSAGLGEIRRPAATPTPRGPLSIPLPPLWTPMPHTQHVK